MHGDFEVTAAPPYKQELFSSWFPEEAQQGNAKVGKQSSLLRAQKAPPGLLYCEVGTLTSRHMSSRGYSHVPYGTPQTWPYCLAAGTIFLPYANEQFSNGPGDPLEVQRENYFYNNSQVSFAFFFTLILHKDKVEFSRDYM